MAFCVSRGKLFIFISNSPKPFTICVVGVVMFSVGSKVSIAPTFRNKFKFISILPTADIPPPPIPISLHVILEDRSLDSILFEVVTKGILGVILLHLIS